MLAVTRVGLVTAVIVARPPLLLASVALTCVWLNTFAPAVKVIPVPKVADGVSVVLGLSETRYTAFRVTRRSRSLRPEKRRSPVALLNEQPV